MNSVGAPLLRVRDLAVEFRSEQGIARAVDGISFSIAPGETLALVGESGCGKSTTARLVLRLWQPTSGEITLEGRNVHPLEGNDLRWFRTNVQAVFQDPWASLSPRMRSTWRSSC